MKCYIHEDRNASTMCARCKKGICDEDANEVEGRNYCPSCVEKLEEELIAIQARARAKKHPLPEEKEKDEAPREREEEEIEEREERREKPEHRRATEAPPWVDREAQFSQSENAHLRRAQIALEEKKEEKPKLAPKFEPVAKAIWAPKPAPGEPAHVPSGPKQVLKVSTREMMLPALVGGMLMGFAMGIPPLYLCCVSWVIGGVVSVYLVSSNSPTGGIVEERDAMKTGALTGLFGVVIGVIVMFTANTLLKDALMLPMSQNLGSDYAHFLLGLKGRDFAIKFISMIVLFPILGALGGILTSKYMKRG